MRSQARISFPPTLLTRIKQGTRRQGCPEPLTLFWRMRGQPAVSDGSVMQPFEARRRLEGSLTHFVAAGGNETRPRRATDGRGMRRHKFDTPPHAQFTANAMKKWGGRGGAKHGSAAGPLNITQQRSNAPPLSRRIQHLGLGSCMCAHPATARTTVQTKYTHILNSHRCCVRLVATLFSTFSPVQSPPRARLMGAPSREPLLESSDIYFSGLHNATFQR